MTELIATSVTTFPLHYNVSGKLVRENEFVQINIAPKTGKIGVDKTFQNLEITTDEKEIGDNWDWREIKIGGNHSECISRVFDQKNCSCAWINAVIQVMNDVHLCDESGQGLGMNPLIDITQIMSKKGTSLCKNFGCDGGDPLKLVKIISKVGIQLKESIGYDWCYDSKYCCTLCGDESLSEKTIKKYCNSKQMKRMNKKIPKKRRKKAKSGVPVLYIDNIKTPVVGEGEIEKVKKLQNYVKNHIREVGPIVISIPVGKRFDSGDFLVEGKNENALFFDKYDYEKEEFNEDFSEKDSFHVMSVVGWGRDDNVSKTMFSNDLGIESVPYWIVRNSWGEKWGVDGYVHLPMYPYNTQSQIEVGDNRIIMFRPSLIPFYLRGSTEFFEIDKPIHIRVNSCQMFVIVVLFILILCKLFE